MSGAIAPRRIWLCADDYGIAPGVNAAICDLMARGRINAASVMVVAPAFHSQSAADLIRATENGGAIGLHLTLTAPFRPLSGAFRPLADAFLGVGPTLAAALLRRFNSEGLRREVRAQLAAFTQAFGHAPDYVDGHQHVQLFPQIRDVVIDAVRAQAPNAWLRQCGSVRPISLIADPKGLLVDTLSRTFRRRARAANIATNAAFAGTYAYAANADFAALFPRFLAGLPDNSLVMCHPGRVDPELRRLDPLTTLREKEYDYLASDNFPQVLARAGITLM
jgi:predicted glycoside hydrolase/deacetylase ChbG (UPF0249 family)